MFALKLFTPPKQPLNVTGENLRVVYPTKIPPSRPYGWGFVGEVQGVWVYVGYMQGMQRVCGYVQDMWSRLRGEYVQYMIWYNMCYMYIMGVWMWYMWYKKMWVHVLCVCKYTWNECMLCICSVLPCTHVVFMAYMLSTCIPWGEDVAGVGVFFLCTPFITYIIVCFPSMFVGGRESLSWGQTLTLCPFTLTTRSHTSLAYTPSSFQSGFQCPLHRTRHSDQA